MGGSPLKLTNSLFCFFLIQGGQTKEHTMLVRTMGVTHLIVAVNKMDDKTVEWSEKRFNDITRDILDFVKKVSRQFNVRVSPSHVPLLVLFKAGFKKEQVTCIPLAALSGQNVREKIDPAICSWYKGNSLLETLDEVTQSRDNDASGPLRLSVLDRYKDAGKVYVIGKVKGKKRNLCSLIHCFSLFQIDGGALKVGDTVVVLPGEHEAQVGGIESEFGTLREAKAGDNVTLWLKGK